MNKKLILNLINKGESETVEFKASFDQAAIETIVAFANTKGGHVIIGVTDAGKINGVQLGKETIQQWINHIKANTSPSLIPDVTVHAIDLTKQTDCVYFQRSRYYREIWIWHQKDYGSFSFIQYA